jgi:hypothetical protein
MPSELKSETAPINGAESHGPSTPQDGATSWVNPSSHGITARTLILQNESKDLFLDMLNAYFDLFLPANQMEIDIVSDIAAARWRLRRMWRYQTAILDIEVDNQAVEFEKRYLTFDEDMRGAAAFSAVADNSKGYATALRHDIHLTRTYRKAIDDLRRLRGGNILPKIPVLQNEPKLPDLNPLDATKESVEISTEPKEPTEARS